MKKKVTYGLALIVTCLMLVSCDKGNETIQNTDITVEDNQQNIVSNENTPVPTDVPTPTATPSPTPQPTQEPVAEQEINDNIPHFEYQGELSATERAEIENSIGKLEQLTNE